MTEEQRETIAEIRRRAGEYRDFIDRIGSSRALSIAITKIDEAALWARAGVEELGGNTE